MLETINFQVLTAYSNMLSSVCPSSAPEFLCDHYGFCDVIPPNCIQMRNLILSAFTLNLNVDMLPKISIAPRMVTNFAGLIKPSFKKDLDSFLKTTS